MEYPGNVRPDQLYEVPITGGELHISPSTDVLHYYPWLDAWILKYFDTDHEPPRLCNVVIDQRAAEQLVTHLDLEICTRTFITESELEHVRQWGAAMLDAVFGAEFDDPNVV